MPRSEPVYSHSWITQCLFHLHPFACCLLWFIQENNCQNQFYWAVSPRRHPSLSFLLMQSHIPSFMLIPCGYSFCVPDRVWIILKHPLPWMHPDRIFSSAIHTTQASSSCVLILATSPRFSPCLTSTVENKTPRISSELAWAKQGWQGRQQLWLWRLNISADGKLGAGSVCVCVCRGSGGVFKLWLESGHSVCQVIIWHSQTQDAPNVDILFLVL